MRLRTTKIAFAFAAALVAAAPASAQRASLAERVAALETQAANAQGNLDLLNQVASLKGEVQALRAQIEELQHQVEQGKGTARSQYLDLDGRLERLEGGAPAGAAAAGGASAPEARPAPAKPAKAAAPVAQERPPTVHGDAGKLAEGAGERDAYLAAFALLQAGDYAASAAAFQSFLGRWPGGTYAPNALYWLGQSYYLTGNFALALEQFQSLVARHPTHDKAVDGLLKVGLSQYGLKQYDAAERTLADVARRHPGTVTARTAQDRLDAIAWERAR